MYIKLNNGVIDKYPYSFGNLKEDNPQISFPKEITNEFLAQWDMFPVNAVPQIEIDYTKNISESQPQLVNGEWTQVWQVTDATEKQIAERLLELQNQTEQNRANAYRNESDPLFFKWQRAESTQQEWLDKIAEIKAKYPKP